MWCGGGGLRGPWGGRREGRVSLDAGRDLAVQSTPYSIDSEFAPVHVLESKIAQRPIV